MLNNIDLKTKTSPLQGWIRLAIKILVVAVAFGLIFTLLFGIKRMNGISMDGRVKDGDLILFDRTINEFLFDDVVIYTHDGKEYVSTIVATAGDVLTSDQEGHLLINNEQYANGIVFDSDLDEENTLVGPIRVPADGFYVVNENLDDISDSRKFGIIYRNDIKGKLIGLLRTRFI